MSFRRVSLVSSLIFALLPACTGPTHKDVGGKGGAGATIDAGGGVDQRRELVLVDLQVADAWIDRAPQYSELWYSSGDKLVYVQINKDDGSVVQLVPSAITGLKVGQNSITMLNDGSLLLLRQVQGGSTFYHLAHPPRDGSPAEYRVVGDMPEGIMIEALYTDCIGRLYGMDTGADVGSATGNRLLLFTGDYLGGDLTYRVVTDLATASTADIDDMGPRIDVNGSITDNPGTAIDTGDVYDFDYQTGTGTKVGKGGSWGIHALGGPLFTDGTARLYVMSDKAELFMMDPVAHTLSDVLATGPTVNGDVAGHSGLGGPLTNCQTGFVIP